MAKSALHIGCSGNHEIICDVFTKQTQHETGLIKMIFAWRSWMLLLRNNFLLCTHCHCKCRDIYSGSKAYTWRYSAKILLTFTALSPLIFAHLLFASLKKNTAIFIPLEYYDAIVIYLLVFYSFFKKKQLLRD